MYRYKIVAFLLLVVVGYSCSNDDNGSLVDPQVVNLVIDTSYEFRAGDEIGIFVEERTNRDVQSAPGTSNYQRNIKWIYQEDGNWKPDKADDIIYTSENGLPLDIYAYYPYTAQITGDEIKIAAASAIKSGKALDISGTQAKLTLQDKTTLVKVIVPDTDILSSLQLTMLDVLSGGILSLSRLGENNDFAVPTNKSNPSLVFENGYYCIYLPEQVFEQSKHLLNIREGDNTVQYHIPEQVSIKQGNENQIIVNNEAINQAGLPNTFMLEPGEQIFLSVQKAYTMWHTNNLLASTLPDLNGEVTAEVVWQEDSSEVIEEMKVIGTGENAIIHIKTLDDKPGNAVVAVKIGNVIRWSWQLWVSDYNPQAEENGTTYTFNGFVFMDRNLGATTNPEAGGDRTFGLYYQWGRKDPFPTRGKVESIAVNEDIPTNLANAIVHPGTFITSSSGQNDWYAKTGNHAPDRWNSHSNGKTEFDPCPRGWRVPVRNEGGSPWNGLTIPGDENKWGNGWYFEDTPVIGYYPAAGQRTATGSMTYAGSAGFYHAANSGATMRIDFTSVNLSFGGGKAAARSVRCVKE